MNPSKNCFLSWTRYSTIEYASLFTLFYGHVHPASVRSLAAP